MSPQATFGFLNEKATIGAYRAIMRTANLPFGSRSVAASWMGGYLRTVQAIEKQMWTIKNSTLPTLGLHRPHNRVLGREVDELFNILATRKGNESQVRMAHQDLHANMWDPVAVALNASSDLIATHFSYQVPRTLEGQFVLGDRDGQLAALASTSDLLVTVLDARDRLALQAAQAGFDWPQLEKAIPVESELLAAARMVVARQPHTLSPAWDELTVAHVPIQTDDPAREFAGRLHRVRQHAWALSRDATPSLGDVRHLATVNLELHAVLLLDGNEGQALERANVVDSAQGWQQVHRALQSAQGLEPMNKVLLRDHERIVQLMSADSPLAPADRRKLVTQAVTHSPEMARELQAAFNVLRQRDALYIPYVPGEVRIEPHELGSVKRGGFAEMKADQKQSVLDGLQQAAGTHEPTPHRTAAVEPVDLAPDIEQDRDHGGIQM